ncbi:hypothetical protein M948_20170 [Virgibacillus sp. CM-4]|nr:hypothetical protein M948_20170 [Virgibacillus sp. CM-4]
MKLKNKTRTVITFVYSLLIFAIGIFRILTVSLSSTPLFVAYIFVIVGFIVFIVNEIILRKLLSSQSIGILKEYRRELNRSEKVNAKTKRNRTPVKRRSFLIAISF